MKKTVCLLLVWALLITLAACTSGSGDIMEPVSFYYIRNIDDPEDFISESSEGIIAPETREAAGHTGDLEYLLALYLQGPSDNTLRSPFPAGCKLLKVYREDGTLHLRLNETLTQLQNLDLTLACACLARTCMALTDVQEVCITAQSSVNTPVDITIRADSLLLVDESTLPVETIPQK